jgi:2-succinyl-6-hydroxy-2,4-cyclohexadiene-1-carboxylate synthase
MGFALDVTASGDRSRGEAAATDCEWLGKAGATGSGSLSELLAEAGVASGESLNAVWVEFIVEMLSTAGVRHAVLCPGGRASVMCLALDAHPRIAVEMVCTDERSGAFVALGIAKASGEPVAIVTTSGSAVANVLPALTEADASDVPLVVLTCDRPRALRGSGFGQMADHLGATRAFVTRAGGSRRSRRFPAGAHASP